MPLWTKTRPPVWVPQSEATERGWQDPVTGEVYVAIGDLSSASVAKINRVYTDKKLYKIGDTLKVYVKFSEKVEVTGTPRITINLNGSGKVASYAAGDGTSTLRFDYTILEGEDAAATEVVSVSPIDLNSGTILDTLGSGEATLTFAQGLSTPDLDLVVVDATKPTFSGEAIASSAHGTAPVTDDILTITITASESVVVTGTPQVALTINGTTRQADYDPATSTATSLKFKYTVVAEDIATAGQFTVGSLGLNSGTIKDVPGNAADLTSFDAPNTAAWTVN